MAALVPLLCFTFIRAVIQYARPRRRSNHGIAEDTEEGWNGNSIFFQVEDESFAFLALEETSDRARISVAFNKMKGKVVVRLLVLLVGMCFFRDMKNRELFCNNGSQGPLYSPCWRFKMVAGLNIVLP